MSSHQKLVIKMARMASHYFLKSSANKMPTRRNSKQCYRTIDCVQLFYCASTTRECAFSLALLYVTGQVSADWRQLQMTTTSLMGPPMVKSITKLASPTKNLSIIIDSIKGHICLLAKEFDYMISSLNKYMFSREDWLSVYSMCWIMVDWNCFHRVNSSRQGEQTEPIKELVKGFPKQQDCQAKLSLTSRLCGL